MLKNFDHLLEDTAILSILEDMLYRAKGEAYHKRDNGIVDYRGKNATYVRDPYYISEEYLRSLLEQDRDLCVNERSYLYMLDKSTSELKLKMAGAMFKHFPKDSILMTGKFFYPDGGFMGWHTNTNHKGTRIYFSYSDEGKSTFNYYNRLTDEVVITQDLPGWTVRGFDIDTVEPFWHSVDCNNPNGRFSFGFNIRRVLRE